MMKSIVVTLFYSLSLLAATSGDIKIPVHYDILNNGLRLLVVPDTNVAVVSCRLYYFVGSMYESAGYTGLAHMFEHMMFKGTKKLGTTDYAKEVPLIKSIDSLDRLLYLQDEKGLGVNPASSAPADVQRSRFKIDSGKITTDASLRAQIAGVLEKQRAFIKKDEIWDLYKNNGGTHLNAWTADDMTAYIVTLPKNKVELFYWIEADRMREPILREFVSERDVVMEERRMRYDNRPIGRYWERLNALFYVASPYRNPTIGWAPDIRAFTREKLDQYIHRYYTPDNALIVLVGNIDPANARKEVERYFGSIPRAPQPKQEIVTREPSPIGETRFTVFDEATPRIDMLFHTPGYPHDDLYKLDVIGGIFSGRSGRLYRRLVDKEGLCTSIDAENDQRLFDGYFQISAELKADADPAKVERIIREEVAAAAATPPTAVEMRRITNEIRMSFVSDLKDLEGLSDRLAWFERLHSWKDMVDYPDRIAQVKAEDIPAVVKKYLDTAVMTIGYLKWRPKVEQPAMAIRNPVVPRQDAFRETTALATRTTKPFTSAASCPAAPCKSSVSICGAFSIAPPPYLVSSADHQISVVPRMEVMFTPGNLFEKATSSVPACTVRIDRSENGYLVPEKGHGLPSDGESLQPKLLGITWLFPKPGIIFCDSVYSYKTTKQNATVTFSEKGPVLSGISKTSYSPASK
jgi:predicted Zn-dependent peptidase